MAYEPIKPATREEAVELLASVIGRHVFARKAGLQYGGKRDIYTAAGYPPQEGIEFEDYWGMYRRNELAARIIELPAKTTWRTPPEVIEMPEEEVSEGTEEELGAENVEAKKDTPFTSAVKELAKRIRLWHYCSRADVCSGIGRFGCLLIVVRGIDDSGLAAPLGKLKSTKDVATLAPYTEGNIQIKEIDWSPTLRFGQPLIYRIRLSGSTQFNAAVKGGKPAVEKWVDVHWTRVIHIAEGKLENEILGTPRLERAFNRLFDLDKIAASVGETYWQAAGSRLLQAEIDKDAEVTDAQLDVIEEKLGEITHDLRRQFLGRGIKLDWLSGEVTPVKDIGDFYFSLIAAAAGIPKRIMFGSELGELASTTDQQTFFGAINERQEHFAEPEILRAFVDRIMDAGALPRPVTGAYKVVWPTLFEESEKEVAEANARTAMAAQALAGPAGDPLALVEVDEDRRVFLVPRKPEDLPPNLFDTNGSSPTLPPPDPPGGEDAEEED
jgi:hypothetical protein